MKTLRFVVIGAGMSGILATIKIKERGHEVVTLEKAHAIGGTWRDNRYPGLCCDTPAHTYTFTFEPYAEWTRNYVPGHEIQAYFEKMVEKHNIGPDIRLGQEVTAVTFGDTTWTVETAAGLRLEADVVVVATGVLHHPRMPDIEGLDSFAGVAMHTARWDDGLDLSDKRVGVIGNGSTGIQLVSALAGRVEALVHFQRSPQWIRKQEHVGFSEAEREAFRRDPARIEAIRKDPAFLQKLEFFTSAIIDADGPGIRLIEDECRTYLESAVKDPELREKLRPSYRAACKRIVGSPDYYEKVQLPGVTVEVGDIARIERAGVRMADGKLYALDVLALATGFNAHQFIRPAVVTGRGGVTLDEAWANVATAYYAIAIPDFPNFFMLNGPSAPVGNFSLTEIAEYQWDYISQLVSGIEAGRYAAISPKPEAMRAYREAHKQAARKTIFASGCTSWYLDAEGVPMNWPYSYKAFRDAMAKPVFEDFEAR
jgi:cation diffusion facilitator CzcD-associated flavoprotein CzcO